MKKLIILFCLTLIVLASCHKDAAFKINTYPQKWQLTQINSQIGTFKGDNLTFQETYVLNSDSTFTKTRLTGNTTQTATGSFSVKGNTIEFTFNNTEGNDAIVNSCNSTAMKEEMTLKSNTELANDTGMALDCPGYFYQRVE